MTGIAARDGGSLGPDPIEWEVSLSPLTTIALKVRITPPSWNRRKFLANAEHQAND
jgi:hypothetical protein